MKKINSIVLTIFTLMIIFINVVYAEATTRVIDDAGLLTKEEKTTLETTIADIKNRHNFDLVIVTKKNLEGKMPQAYADDYYDKNGYGIGKSKDGMLFLLSTETRDYHISTSGYGIDAFTDYGIGYIGENAVKMLKDNNYYSAFKGYLSDADIFLTQAQSAEPFDNSNPVRIGSVFERASSTMGIIIPISILLALFVVLSMRRKHKTARPKDFANEYVEGNSFNLIKENDIFLNSTMTKTKIQKESSGDGSTTHISSSGQEHGGGGGKY